MQPTNYRPLLPWQLLVVWIGALAVAPTLTADPPCAPGHVLVCFKPEARVGLDSGTREGQLLALTTRLNLPKGTELSETPLAHLNRARRGSERLTTAGPVDLNRFLYLRLPPGLTPAECVRRLAQHPLIDYVEPDWIGTGAETIPDDPGFADQWHHRNSLNPSASIQTPLAWDITQGSSNVVVAVLDSGLADLPEFAGRTVPVTTSPTRTTSPWMTTGTAHRSPACWPPTPATAFWAAAWTGTAASCR